MTVKKVRFKFLFKCRQCQWWRHFWRWVGIYVK